MSCLYRRGSLTSLDEPDVGSVKTRLGCESLLGQASSLPVAPEDTTEGTSEGTSGHKQPKS